MQGRNCAARPARAVVQDEQLVVIGILQGDPAASQFLNDVGKRICMSDHQHVLVPGCLEPVHEGSDIVRLQNCGCNS